MKIWRESLDYRSITPNGCAQSEASPTSTISFLSQVVIRSLPTSTKGISYPEFEEVVTGRPDVFLCFSEEEYPIDPHNLVEERGWKGPLNVKIVESSVRRGQNLIQEGPSIVETASWLQEQRHT